jgi:hypothetical protein
MKTGVKTARLKKTLVPADFSDFPRYGSSYAIVVACQSQFDLRVFRVMDQSITRQE